MPGPADATLVTDAQKKAPAEYKAVVAFLRGSNGPKVRYGILNGKRVDYFKAKTAIRVLCGPAYAKAKKVPPVANEEEARDLLNKILPHAFFLRVDRPKVEPPTPTGHAKPLMLCPQQSLDEDAFYAWFYEGSELHLILGGIAMVIIILAGVMFPLWPVKLRIGVWYLSIGVLILIGAFIGLAIFRLIFWCITVLSMKRAIWIFPNLFEDVGFVDSFIPGWAYDEPKKKKQKKSKKALSPKDSAATSAGEGDGEGDGPTKVVKATAVDADGSAPGLRSRQAATVEEIDDEE